MAEAFSNPMVLVAFLGFLGILANGFFAWRAGERAKASLVASKENAITLAATGVHIEKIKDDLHTVEVSTNSMKDALVKATAEASFAKGGEEARLDAEKTAKDLLKKKESK